jgi:hypothetical protein
MPDNHAGRSGRGHVHVLLNTPGVAFRRVRENRPSMDMKQLQFSPPFKRPEELQSIDYQGAQFSEPAESIHISIPRKQDETSINIKEFYDD